MAMFYATLEYIEENSHSFGQRRGGFFVVGSILCSTLANDDGLIAHWPIENTNGQFDVGPASLAQQVMCLQFVIQTILDQILYKTMRWTNVSPFLKGNQ